MPELAPYIPDAQLDRLIAAAIAEDLGPARRDLTSELTIPADTTGRAAFVTRAPGIACGLALLPRLAAAFDPRLSVELHAHDGQPIAPGQTLAAVAGPLRAVLAFERTALNFVTHLSGVATLTARYVEAVRGTNARIYDTRKTLPAFRGLAKYAVACGGGSNHRRGLFDAVLIKDNHLAHTPLDTLADTLKSAARPLPGVEVECDTLAQVERVLAMGVDLILLDNMPPDALRQAVALRDRINPSVQLEASGGVNLDTVRAVAQTGVERIAVGAITHSAPALDVGLDIHD